MALWSLLGARGVDVFAWESFGKEWVRDIVRELSLEDVRVYEAGYGDLPDLSQADFSRDVVFTWNGTTSGVRVPDARWIAEQRQGLVICDATSAVFAQPVVWEKLDVTTFSWQKVLGGEAAHGMIILSPRAVERLENTPCVRPLPKIFRLTKDGALLEGIFRGETINTPSMLCVEDYLDALGWARAQGGLKELLARANANLEAVARWVERTPWVAFLCSDPAWRSNTSVCLRVEGPKNLPKRMVALLEEEKVAYDINAYRDAPAGLRLWTGATVETEDLEALFPWLEWAYEEGVKDA